MDWVDNREDDAGLRRHFQADLAALDWHPSQERYASTDVLRVALRCGGPCTAGIVLAGGYVSTQEWADRIRTAHHEGRERISDTLGVSPRELLV